jgi:hypothetical protein
LNIAGYTNQIAIITRADISHFFSEIFAESIVIGPISSINGTTFSNSSTGGIPGSGSIPMISVLATFIGCQLRLYGQYSLITILTGAGSNMMHFRIVPSMLQSFYPPDLWLWILDFRTV